MPDPIAIMARAMSASKAWPVVFEAGSGTTLARAALSALYEAGFVVVPVEPTKEMYEAAFDALVPAMDAQACYRAMIAAAQVPHDKA